jgi:exopolysaccharide biosynthesis polyprenyl glycosylphosphotransferase
MRKSEFLVPFGRIINDGVMTFLALLFAYFLRMRWFGLLGLSAPTTLFPLELFYVFAFKIALALVVVFALNGRYNFNKDEKTWDEIIRVFWTFSSGMALLLVAFFFVKFTFFSRFIFGVSWLMGLILILSGRISLRWARNKFHEMGYGRVRILVLGTGEISAQAIAFLRQSPQFEIVGVLSEKKKRDKKFEKCSIIGTFDDFEAILAKEKPDEVLVTSENSTEKVTAKLVRLAHIAHVKFRFLPDELGLDLAAVEMSTLGNFPLVTLKNTKLDDWGFVFKSTVDIITASIASIFLSPVLAIVALKVWNENKKAPVIYKSKRVGKNGKHFNCLKFRTMVPDADEKKKKLLKKNQRKGGVLFKMDNDPRITKLGKILRKWSIDELPQLWNVIRGDMSLIGPRPHLPEEVRKYAKDDLRVLSIRPGITGFAQVNGRSSLSFKEEMNYELFYLKNWSFKLDIIIFIKSLLVVLKRKNVS